MKSKSTMIFGTALLVATHLVLGQVDSISTDSLKTIINDCQFTTDYLLLDVRDSNEVVNGIIASDFCKPYHMSLRSGQLAENYSILPKETPVYIYCRTGRRSREAAMLLDSNGFTKVYTIIGGITAYTGTLWDSTNFTDWQRLPHPSFTANNCVKVIGRLSPPPNRSDVQSNSARLFTLQGRLAKSSRIQQCGQVFILERIDRDKNRQREGLHRLVLLRK